MLFKGPTNRVKSIAWNKDDHYFCCSDFSGSIFVYRIEDQQRLYDKTVSSTTIKVQLSSVVMDFGMKSVYSVGPDKNIWKVNYFEE